MANEVLAGCEVSANEIGQSLGRLKAFMERYAGCFRRQDTAANAELFVAGLLSDLPRKSVEPIAERYGAPQRTIQYFVGASPWDDEDVTAEMRRHVAETWGDPRGILVIDPSTFPKQGTDSVGVARQWCGRLGKIENCQKGVFIAYATPKGTALVDRQLYLPEDWANDTGRREKCHVPEDVEFGTAWEIAAELVERCRSLPHTFVTGDDELGRASELRDLLRDRGEQYVLNVPSNTLVRPKGGAWTQASDWAKAVNKGSWFRCHVRDGTRGPLYVWAVTVDVQTKRDGRTGPWERLLVTKTMSTRPELSYSLTNAPSKLVPLSDLVRVAGARHEIEEVFQRAKGEVGFAQYELRSWVGWHHHMTLAMLALWSLELEREQQGGKMSGDDAAADRLCHGRVAARSQLQPRRPRTQDQPTALSR